MSTTNRAIERFNPGARLQALLDSEQLLLEGTELVAYTAEGRVAVCDLVRHNAEAVEARLAFSDLR